MQTESFADKAFYPVTSHGITNLPVYADPQTTFRLVACQINKCESAAAQPPAAAVYLIKLPCFPKKTKLREPVLLHQDLSGQPFSPLGTPALDDSLTGTGSHANPKTMCTFTLDVTGLKSSFAHDIIPLMVFGLLNSSRP